MRYSKTTNPSQLKKGAGLCETVFFRPTISSLGEAYDAVETLREFRYLAISLQADGYDVRVGSSAEILIAHIILVLA